MGFVCIPNGLSSMISYFSKRKQNFPGYKRLLIFAAIGNVDRKRKAEAQRCITIKKI